jgi:hypothetical protein
MQDAEREIDARFLYITQIGNQENNQVLKKGMIVS